MCDVGSGVGLPGVYVGAAEGDTVGCCDGADEGTGVGLPAVYVGSALGDSVGAQVGLLGLYPWGFTTL